MRSAGGVLGGMSLERAERTHVSTYKLQKCLEMDKFGTNSAAKGGPGAMRGEG